MKALISELYSHVMFYVGVKVGPSHEIKKIDLLAFEIRVPREVFGMKDNRMTGGCKKIPVGELHNLYASQNTIKEIKS
jgi:hypothetical protein